MDNAVAPLAPNPPLSTGEIVDVSMSTSELMRTKYAAKFWGIVVATSLLGVGIFFLTFGEDLSFTNIGENLGLLLFSFMPLILGVSTFYISIQNKVESLFMQQMGQEFGYTYAEKDSLDSVSGNFFTVGHARAISRVLSGMYTGYPIRCFFYMYTTGEGKSQELHPFTVFELTYPKVLPHILFNMKEYMSSDVEAVELEGDFNKTCSLFITKGDQMEVRELFQPDIMTFLMDMTTTSVPSDAFETIGNKLYVHQYGLITTRDRFLASHQRVATIIEKLLPGFAEIASSDNPTSLTTQA